MFKFIVQVGVAAAVMAGVVIVGHRATESVHRLMASENAAIREFAEPGAVGVRVKKPVEDDPFAWMRRAGAEEGPFTSVLPSSSSSSDPLADLR
jgi:hypothetical protein